MNAMMQSIPEAYTLFKTKLNSYWAGDIATTKSRFSEYTKGDQQWDLFRHWIEESGEANLGDKAAFYMANIARSMNDWKFLTVLSTETEILGHPFIEYIEDWPFFRFEVFLKMIDEYQPNLILLQSESEADILNISEKDYKEIFSINKYKLFSR